MRKNTFFLCLSLGLAGLLTSCSSDNALGDEPSEGQGKVTLTLEPNVTFTLPTRAVDESSYTNFDDYTVKIEDSRGNEKFNGTYATLKTRMPLTLDLGSYNVYAEYGTEYASSRDGFLVKGENSFTIAGDQTTTTTVNCTPTAGKILVAFDAAMATYYDDYNVDFSGTAALGSSVAHWGKTDTAPFYVKLNEGGETVNYTIYLTAKADYATSQNGEKLTSATATGSFQLQRNKAKKLTVKPNYTPSTEGGLTVVIEIDDTTNDKPITIEVPVTWI